MAQTEYKSSNNNSLIGWNGNWAQYIKSDRKAVEMACLTNYSNGMMEGTVNKIKEIKITMFNRAGIELLRAKVIYTIYGNVIT